MSLTDLLGWIGAAEILAAFGLNSFQKITSDSMTFQLLNFTGGIFLIINSVANHVYPFTVINSVWVIISLIAMIRMMKSNK